MAIATGQLATYWPVSSDRRRQPPTGARIVCWRSARA
jgi:hypothetical protein